VPAFFVLHGRLTIDAAEVDHPSVLVLAERFQLTGYDASYLWLAQQLNAELVTLDQQLARAASRLRSGC
jgi:predicted nucleic acid-binding protein